MRRNENELFAEINKIKKLLKSGRFITKMELCNTLKLQAKTVERRLKEIKETETNYILTNEKRKGYQLNKIIKSTHSINSIKDSLKNDKYLNKNPEKIITLQNAISARQWVTLVNYSPANGRSTYSRKVLPLVLVFANDTKLVAIDSIEKKQLKTYLLSRCDKVIFTPDKETINLDPIEILSDDFGILYLKGEKVDKIELLLTSYSSKMIVHDFPLFKDKIKELPTRKWEIKQLNNKKYKYTHILKLNLAQIGATGRIVCGMLDHIIVKASDDFKARLREYVKQTVFNAFEENI